MIPGKILNFLENLGTIAVSGTRDANLRPHVHYVSGWDVEPDKQTIRCSIHQAYSDQLISSLEDNGQFALTVEQIGSHETYQFKGSYVGSDQPNQRRLRCPPANERPVCQSGQPGIWSSSRSRSSLHLGTESRHSVFGARNLSPNTWPWCWTEGFPPEERNAGR